MDEVVSLNKTFSAADITKCIEIACNELNIDKESLKYEVLEEKKSFFKRKASILVKIADEVPNDISSGEGLKDYSSAIDAFSGTVMVNDGKIIVKNPVQNGTPAWINCPNNIHIKVNGADVNGKLNIHENDSIEVTIDEVKPSREIQLDISADNMEAYISIIYNPGIKFILKDLPECSGCNLETTAAEKNMPPSFTFDEVMQKLSEKNISYGIMKDKIPEIIRSGCQHLLIAKGNKPIDSVDDSIGVNFKTDSDILEFSEDTNGNIDFKSIGSISGVNEGDIIAVKKAGHNGTDGVDVSGNIVKSKAGKKLKLKAGAGCSVKGECIVASISGKPCLKGSIFYVFKVHEVDRDVDISTGNIKFIGDIIVYGSVKEGMELDSGNSVIIYKDVERAKISSSGSVTVGGNIISSEVTGGGKDVIKLRLLENIKNLQNSIESLMEMVSEIKKYNLLGEDKRDGEIIKLLIDNRVKTLPRLCLSIITDITQDKDDFSEDRLTELIKSKLIGLAPINIKHVSELTEISECINEKVNWINSNIAVPVDVKFYYCQDSNINSSGNIIISGKGEFVSNISAGGNIIFTDDQSVARGGKIKAVEKIECKSVGSSAGVSTKLEVEKNGHIYANIAYHNTVLVIGNREYILEADSKNLHAFIDNNDDIIVDKFLM